MAKIKNQILRCIKLSNIDSGTLEYINEPESFFGDSVQEALYNKEFVQITKIVRAAFGTEMTDEDIYNHLTEPKKVYLFRIDGDIFAMASYTPKNILANPLLFVDGIAIHPSMQGKNLFSQITLNVLGEEKLIGLRTQNPRMYRALEKICNYMCPNFSCDYHCPNSNSTKNIFEVKNALALDLNMALDERGVARGFYKKSLYKNEQTHNIASKLFNDILKLNYDGGDSVLCMGIRK